VEITLANTVYTVERFKFRRWLELEEIRYLIYKAADRLEAVKHLLAYISAAIDIPVDKLEHIYWFDIYQAYAQIVFLNTPRIQFPILRPISSSKEVVEEIWEYPGRIWYYWVHVFAQSYGWSILQIADLPIEDAIGLIQEILLDKQLTKEWEWSLTELAYSYNSSTNKTEFHPLDRPSWMKRVEEPKETKIKKIPRYFMPVGIIYRGEKTVQE